MPRNNQRAVGMTPAGTGKIAVIAAAASGIGHAACRWLPESGDLIRLGVAFIPAGSP